MIIGTGWSDDLIMDQALHWYAVTEKEKAKINRVNEFINTLKIDRWEIPITRVCTEIFEFVLKGIKFSAHLTITEVDIAGQLHIPHKYGSRLFRNNTELLTAIGELLTYHKNDESRSNSKQV